MEEKRRRIASGSAPVLARLPDVSAELPETKTASPTAPNKLGYRFDPPMPSSRAARTLGDERSSPLRTLKSELVYAPHSTRPLHPHVFEKSWMKPIQSRLKPRESPILPRSNPFAIPRRSITETLSPYLHFATLVALFAAAGTWMQLNKSTSKRTEPTQAPDAAVQQTDSTPTKTVDRPIHAPTAIGPVSATPEAGLRAGRERSNTNYATLRGDILPVGPSDAATMEAAASPNMGPAAAATLPHAQTSEIADAASRERQRPELQPQPEVASRTTSGATNELPPR